MNATTSAFRAVRSGTTEFDNVFVCYTVQNYLKAHYLAFERHARGERSLILAVFQRGTERPSHFETSDVFWAVVRHVGHSNDYIRLLEADRLQPTAYLLKVAQKACARIHRQLLKHGERARLLAEVNRAARVFLFLEKTYFSEYLLRHRRCVLIEEGASTYQPYRYRSLSTLRRVTSFPGAHANIVEILLQRPEHADASVRPKVAKLAFEYRRLPAEVRRTLQRIFPVTVPRGPERSAIIVGQAWRFSRIEPGAVMDLHRRLVALLRERDYAVYVKPHPSDDARDYEPLDCPIVDPRVPLEAFDLGGEEQAFDVAVSVLKSSVAGTRHLARTVVSFVDHVLPVEAVTPGVFQRATADAARQLATALDRAEAGVRG